MNNRVEKVNLDQLLATIGSGASQTLPPSRNIGAPVSTNGIPSEAGNPFAHCNGQMPGTSPFAFSQIPSDHLAFSALHLHQPSEYSSDTGALFSGSMGPPRPGNLEKADSGDSLSWLNDDPPDVDPIHAAATFAGIVQPTNRQPTTQQFQPTVSFLREPGDVQFRYPKELKGNYISPIRALGTSRQYPAIAISNVQPERMLTLEVSLLNQKQVQSRNTFYQTKPSITELPILSYPVQSDQTIELDNIGILRAPADRRGDTELLDTVILGVRLLTPTGVCVANCQSKEILDVKKTNLKIVHINPSKGFNSSIRTEVTILCSKISEDTQVIFQYGSVREKADIVLRHHRVALVVRPPVFPNQERTFRAKVLLCCQSRNRTSETRDFMYQDDPLERIDTAGLKYLHASRDRSPVRPQSRLELDCINTALQEVTLDDEVRFEMYVPQSAPNVIKMADLQRIRDVATGQKAWSECDAELLKTSPYILHVQDEDGFTPPMRALISDQASVLKRMMDGVSPSECARLCSARTPGGATLLHLTAIPTAPVPRALLEAILGAKADPLKTDACGQTVLHWLVRKHRFQLLRTTLECLADFFAANGDHQAFQQLLDLVDASGQSVLHCAVLSKATEAIQILIDKGADIDLRSPNSGFTALHWAIIENDATAVQHLIAGGAATHVETNWGANALDIASQRSEVQTDILRLLRGSSASSQPKD